jgi:L-rhamnose mutarotase
LYQSGSTKFGDTLDDKHESTGSVSITGSLIVNGFDLVNDTIQIVSYTSSLNEYTQSVKNEVSVIQNYTASVKNEVATIQNYTASLKEETTQLFSYTSSLNSYTQSVKNEVAVIQNYTASVKNEVATIQNYTASLKEETTQLFAYTASLNEYTKSVKNEVSTIQNYTSSVKEQISQIVSYTASLNEYTASVKNEVVGLQIYSQSLKSVALVSGSQQVVDYNLFALTASNNTFYGSQTITGNLNLSGASPLLYNGGSTNAMLFGFFDGSAIYGPYYQIFGKDYASLNQRGSAEFVFDSRNGGDNGFNVVELNNSNWYRKFRVSTYGAEVTGSFKVSQEIESVGITASLLATNGVVSGSLIPSSSYSVVSDNARSMLLYSLTQDSESYLLFSNLIAVTSSTLAGNNGIRYNSAKNLLKVGTVSASKYLGDIVSGSQQILDYNLFALTASNNTFYGENTFTNKVTHTNGYIVLAQVSQSLNFVDDAAAALGGVPLGGLYRNGNFIAIRIV